LAQATTSRASNAISRKHARLLPDLIRQCTPVSDRGEIKMSPRNALFGRQWPLRVFDCRAGQTLRATAEGHEFAFATLAVCPLRVELPPSGRAWRSQLPIAIGASASRTAFRVRNYPAHRPGTGRGIQAIVSDCWSDSERITNQNESPFRALSI
jgi:hypothetical protein